MIVMVTYTRSILCFPSATESDKILYLQFVLYYDDVKTNNPLGSHRGKHNLGISNITIYCHVFTMCEP